MCIPGYPRFGPINQRPHSARVFPREHREMAIAGAEPKEFPFTPETSEAREKSSSGPERSDDMGEISSGYGG